MLIAQTESTVSLVLPAKDVLHGSTDKAGVPGGGVGARHHPVLLLRLLVCLGQRSDGPGCSQSGGEVGHAGVGAVQDAGVESVQHAGVGTRGDPHHDAASHHTTVFPERFVSLHPDNRKIFVIKLTTPEQSRAEQQTWSASGHGSSWSSAGRHAGGRSRTPTARRGRS